MILQSEITASGCFLSQCITIVYSVKTEINTLDKTEYLNHTAAAYLTASLQTYHKRPQHKEVLSKWKRINTYSKKYLCSFQTMNQSTLTDFNRFSEDHNFLSSFILMPSGTNNATNLNFATWWHH